MKRDGFSMIEVIFVIAIIGILTAIALPKFQESSRRAHIAICMAATETMNNIVGPALWTKYLAEDGGDGFGVATDPYSGAEYITVSENSGAGGFLYKPKAKVAADAMKVFMMPKECIDDRIDNYAEAYANSWFTNNEMQQYMFFMNNGIEFTAHFTDATDARLPVWKLKAK